MLSRQIAQQSLRGLTTRGSALMPFSAASFAVGNRIQSRLTTTSVISEKAEQDILARQRVNRPVSPHLSIYRPQITWYGSALHRITGTVMSGSLYVFATAYLVAPLLGWHLESASIAAAFGSLPIAIKAFIKFSLSLPFTYHSFNGVRHLWWDLCKGIENKAIIKSGWTVVGLSVASALTLAFI